MNSYQYTATVQDATTLAVDVVDKDNIYTIDRNGIGLEMEDATLSDKEVNVYSYEHKQSQSVAALANRYFIITSVVPSIVNTFSCEIGSVVSDGLTYTFTLFTSGESAYYTAEPGDTATDVKNGLISAINAASWSYLVNASSTGSNTFAVIVDDLSTTATAAITYTLFTSGYKTTFSINGGPLKDYIITQATLETGYPLLPLLEPSYLYTELTYAPAGIENLLLQPGFTQDSFSDSLEGTSDIQNTGEVSGAGVSPGKVAYANGMLYFNASDYLNVGEYFKMLVL